ncbi:MAG TPA: hypothetical protein VF245_04150 [Solirubrobacterales bacterium]
MREAADAERIRRLARELGRGVPAGTRMYLTGGATAVLEGWRDSTIDIDVRFEPDSDSALQEIKKLKERLGVNVELASPLDFIPPLPDWQSRMVRSGRVEPAKLLELFEAIEPELFRFPAVDPPSLRAAVESLIDGR